MSSKTFPTLSLERELFEAGAKFVIGVDEVGRGALFGPVSVGVAVLSADSHTDGPPWPAKLADSKLLTERVREELFEPVGSWVAGWAVGSATNDEIDQLGIVPCLALAAQRAVRDLPEEIRGEVAGSLEHTRVILDGSHNWLGEAMGPVSVKVQTKADRDCVSVAAASVLAKVVRDRAVVDMAEADAGLEAYGVAGNKGYSSERHLQALRELGPTALHRKTWLSKILGEDQLF